ncbi:MAG: hypothetical protein Q8P33_00170, partial [bacterium]|nr:hypothetical protein [bacterium]
MGSISRTFIIVALLIIGLGFVVNGAHSLQAQDQYEQWANEGKILPDRVVVKLDENIADAGVVERAIGT